MRSFPLVIGALAALVLGFGSYQALTGGLSVKNPDLMITDVKVTVTPQKVVNIEAVVVNRGNGRAIANLVGLKIDAGNNGVFEVTTALQKIGQLGVGQTATVRWSNAGTESVFTWAALAGTHATQVCADAGAKPVVKESNEGNNCATEEFVVR